MKSAMRKITYREIRRSLGRFLAIMGIIALGAGFLTGLRVTKSAMLETLNIYVTENAFFDYRIVSTLGLTAADAEYFSALDGVASAEGSLSMDALFTASDGEDRVLRAMSVTEEVNKLKLRAGRMPEAADECVLDAYYYDESAIGTTMRLSSENDEDTRDRFAEREYTVVGLVNSPNYINFTRGTTALGSGSVSGFVCIPIEGFKSDFFTEIFVKLDKTGYVYSDEYDSAIEAFEDTMTRAAQERADLRYERIVSDATAEYDDALADYQDGVAEYEDGLAKYEDGKAEAEQALADSKAELDDAKLALDDAKAELDEAKLEIDDIEEPTVYVLDRYTNTGYANYESDANIVSGVAKVFPIFFFLVAALVCVTTMNRMVDEQRTQIGVLKALGYKTKEIMGGYLLYTGLASGLGSVIGVVLGSVVFPKIIWQAYNIMYGFTDIVLVFDWRLSGIVCAAFLACSLIVTGLSCRSVLREVPAELIRPRTPKAGKRIILEYVPFLWNRFSFLKKVSARNIFRYKKRMLMMIIGIAGCTALLLAGFGLNDSISGLADVQFSEVSIYDASVSFENDMDKNAQQAFQEECGDSVTDCAFLCMYSVDTFADGVQKSVYLVATDERDMSPFMNFETDGVPVAYPGFGEVIINDKLAGQCGLKTGDAITLRNSDMSELTLKVSGVFYNVVNNYAYVSLDTLKAAKGFDSDINMAYVNLNRDAGLYASAAAVSGIDAVAAVKVNDEIRTMIHNMLASMKYIVVLVTFCAGMLAFIVLYNLTNINIKERIREIATIKVLGFNQFETAAYVFRENIVLTLMGAALGIPVGVWLHGYIMSQITIDMISFNVVIHGRSYLYALALTLIFAVIVDVFMYFRLDRINMAESLKSVE